MLITKISYKCTWVITCLFPKGLYQSVVLLWNKNQIDGFCMVIITFLCTYNRSHVTGFAKTWRNEGHAHSSTISRHTNDRAKDSHAGLKFMTVHYSLQGVRCYWGAPIRLHMVSNCCQQPSWSDMCTVAVTVFH